MYIHLLSTLPSPHLAPTPFSPRRLRAWSGRRGLAPRSSAVCLDESAMKETQTQRPSLLEYKRQHEWNNTLSPVASFLPISGSGSLGQCSFESARASHGAAPIARGPRAGAPDGHAAELRKMPGQSFFQIRQQIVLLQWPHLCWPHSSATNVSSAALGSRSAAPWEVRVSWYRLLHSCHGWRC